MTSLLRVLPSYRRISARTLPGAAASAARPSLSARMSDEDGGFVIWSLFTILFILVAVGMGIDTMRTEVQRTRIQHTLDSAILAAADLEQSRDPKAVVSDYFTRVGLDPSAVKIEPTVGVNAKEVTATINTRVETMFLDMVGFNTLPAPAAGTAVESVTDVEVVLVLDNSGSMGWNNDYRLNLLKPAARDFIDTVIRDEADPAPGSVSISIVPFSTQVNAGPALGGALDFSAIHNRSHCAEFTAASYRDASIDPNEDLRRVGHFDAFTFNVPLPNPDTQKDVGVVCPRNESRHITPWSTDAEELKDQINAMFAWGNTSIDVATKWGAALLDPDFRPVLTELVLSEDVDGALLGQPFDYTRANTKKFLVVMSDGQNTSQYRLRDGYRSGPSTLWKDPNSGVYSYFDSERDEYFVLDAADLASEPGGTWESEPSGGDSAVNLSWQDVWAAMSVRRFARDVKAEAMGGEWTTYRNQIQTSTAPGTKNTRTEEICAAARDEGVIIYTIGMDTYGQGDATLNACAGALPGEVSANFFDVNAEEIDQAFAAIARQINQLRLTQ